MITEKKIQSKTRNKKIMIHRYICHKIQKVQHAMPRELLIVCIFLCMHDLYVFFNLLFINIILEKAALESFIMSVLSK